MACRHAKPPGWTRCHECNAVWLRDYRKSYRALEVRLAKREGAEDMRSMVIEHFTRFGGIEFTGRAVAEILRNLGVD